MNKFASLTTAAAVAIMMATGPSAAGEKERDRSAQAAVGIAGFTLGVLAGQAFPDRGPATVRQLPPPQYDRNHPRIDPRLAHRPARTPSWGEPWSREWFLWCSNKYRSFDARTGTFRGFDGRTRFCEMPVRTR